jgi:hypothetical protein
LNSPTVGVNEYFTAGIASITAIICVSCRLIQ